MKTTRANAPIIQQSVSLQIRVIRILFRLLYSVSPMLASRLGTYLFLMPRQRPYSQKALAVLASAQSTTFQHGSRQLQGYIWGEPDCPAILLVHGWESNAGSMRAFVPPLVQRGYRVIAFDAPAHGRSAGSSTTIYDYSGALQSISEEFGPIDGVIAHSLGAVATMLMLGREAQLGVKRVVILAAPANMVDIIRAWGEFLHFPHSVINQMRQRLIDRIGLPIDDQTVERAVANISIPGLIIHDENDSVIPHGNAFAIHNRWKSASVAATQGLDHIGILHSPKTVELSASFITAP